MFSPIARSFACFRVRWMYHPLLGVEHFCSGFWTISPYSQFRGATVLKGFENVACNIPESTGEKTNELIQELARDKMKFELKEYDNHILANLEQ